MSFLDDLGGLFSNANTRNLAGAGIAALLSQTDIGDNKINPVGFTGGIPEYDFVRQRVPGTPNPNRAPGSSGQRYFTSPQFVATGQQLQAPPPAGDLVAAQAAAAAQAQQLAAQNAQGFAQGGLAGLSPNYLNGPQDGMADQIPAQIDGQQPAALSGGEYVVPADAVSHLGNGNSNAGAAQLEAMIRRIRAARTGNPEQGKRVNPTQYMPS